MCFNSTNLSRSLMFALICLLSACGGNAGTTPDATVTPSSVPEITSAGTDFYLTLPDHLCVSEPALCNNLPVTNKLIITATVATTASVSFNNVSATYAVEAGVQSVIMLETGVVLTSNEKVEAKAIHVTALSPISVHVISENATSSDGYLALPVAGLGTEYYVMSRASNRYSGSEFAVAATQNNTSVSITPTAAGASKPAGVQYTVLLNAGETYQFANPGNGDLSGTHITADKPVAVFSGHRCADVPSGAGYCDYLVEQLAGVSLWGKTFHTSPFSGRTNYTVRVIASQNNTTFATVPAGLIGTLNAGQYADVEMNGAGEFVASLPVQMAQFMRGYADDLAAKGDPSMVMVTPAEMGLSDTTFGVYGLAGTSGAYMNIVTETSALPNLTLDGVAANTALFTPIGADSLYSSATLSLAPGAHTLKGTAPHSMLVYDYGIKWNAVSYAYPASRKLSVSANATLPPPSPVPPAKGCDDDGDDEDDEDEHAGAAVQIQHDGRHHHHRKKRHDHFDCHD